MPIFSSLWRYLVGEFHSPFSLGNSAVYGVTDSGKCKAVNVRVAENEIPRQAIS